MGLRPSRRDIIAYAGAMIALPSLASAAESVRLGLTSVFLDNDAEVIARLRDALSAGTGRGIELIQRRTYQEVTVLLLEAGLMLPGFAAFRFCSMRINLRLSASRSGVGNRFIVPI